MKKITQQTCFCCLLLLVNSTIFAQVKTISEDKDWSKQSAFLQNSYEAEYLIRLGDIDNLGFGWPEGFDPFCSRMTTAHNFPWDVNTTDLPGFDRILLSSKYNPDNAQGCGGDGYSGSWNEVTSKPITYSLPTAKVQGITIKDAFLQLFIDDFQAPNLCSKFQITLNGKRFAEGEKFINAIDQSGPVGKLISIPVPEEFYADISGKSSLNVKIDEVTGAADGFALDFIRLLINRKRENTCKGNFHGKVLEKNTGNPIAGAAVFLSDKTTVKTDGEGGFSFTNVPTGFEVVEASFTGYNDGSATADIGTGDENDEVIIYLEKGKQVFFDKQQIKVGEAINLKNILFDQGKSDIKIESMPDLEKVAAFMHTNSGAQIELSGHTSSEGDANYNRSLSYKRVKACKDYIVSKGIDPGRIIANGYGADRPIVPNDSEANRAKNRRVEMRVEKL